MYIDDFGVRYSDDKKTLIKCPEDFHGKYNIPHGVEIIAHSAFCNCTELIEVSIPETVGLIDTCAFSGCSNLCRLEILNTGPTYQDAFEGCEALTSIIIGEHWLGEHLSDYFGHQVKTYIVKEGVTKITKDSFLHAAMAEYIQLPHSITALELGAFAGCDYLKKLIVPTDKIDLYLSMGIKKTLLQNQNHKK